MERKAFLARVTASLDRRERSATRAGAVPRRDGLPTEPGAIAELFASRLAAVGGYAHHAVTRADAQEDIARMLGERGMASLACPAGLRWSAVETLCTDDAENAAFGLAKPASPRRPAPSMLCWRRWAPALAAAAGRWVSSAGVRG